MSTTQQPTGSVDDQPFWWQETVRVTPAMIDWQPAEGITLHPTNGPMLDNTTFLLAWIAGYNLPQPVNTRLWMWENNPELTVEQVNTAMAYFVANEIMFTILDEVPDEQ